MPKHKIIPALIFAAITLVLSSCLTTTKPVPVKPDMAELDSLRQSNTALSQQLEAERQLHTKSKTEVEQRDSKALAYLNEAQRGTVNLNPYVQDETGKRWLFITQNEVGLTVDLFKDAGIKSDPVAERDTALRESATLAGKLAEVNTLYASERKANAKIVEEHTKTETELRDQIKVTDATITSLNKQVDALDLALKKNKLDNQAAMDKERTNLQNTIVLEQARSLNNFGLGAALFAGLCLVASIWLPWRVTGLGAIIAGSFAAVFFAWAQLLTDPRYKWVVIAVPCLVVLITVACFAVKHNNERTAQTKAVAVEDEHERTLSAAIPVIRRIKALYDDGTMLTALLQQNPDWHTVSDLTEGLVYNKLDMTAQQRADLAKIQWVDKQQRADATAATATTTTTVVEKAV